MTIAAALAEAYGAEDISGDVRATVEFDHPTFTGPLRFVQGVPTPDETTLSFPVVPGGAAVPFTIVDFGYTLPGYEEGGSTKARLRLDNVSQQLQQALRAAISSDQPFSVVMRFYSTNDLDHPEVYTGLRMGSVSVTATSASGDLTFEEIEMKAFPGETYTLAKYPALYGQ